MTRRLVILLVLVLAPFACAGEEAPKTVNESVQPETNESQDQRWEWTAEEEEQVVAIERQVKQNDDGSWEYKQGSYIFRSFVSERFTAEMAVYAELFENMFNGFLSTLPTKRELPENFRVEIMTFSKHQKRPPEIPVKFFESDNSGIAKTTFDTLTRQLTSKIFLRFRDSDFSSAANERFRRSLQHEAAHIYTSAMTGMTADGPIFLYEVVAYFFGWVNIREWVDMRKVSVTAVRTDAKPRLSLAKYVTMGDKTFNDPSRELNHAMAMNFAFFMMRDKARRELLWTMMERIFAGQKPFTNDEIKKLEPEWKKFNQSFPEGTSK